MYSNVKQLRQNGIRHKHGPSGEGVFGEVMLIHHNGYPCLKVKRFGDASQDAKLLPDLWNAQCKNFQGNAMRWEGFQVEREGGPAVFQEWMITIISDRPPATEMASVRSPYETHGQR